MMVRKEVLRMRLLIIEDDSAIQEMLVAYLSKDGSQCVSAYSGSEAELRVSYESFDVILLDLMIPGICGEDLISILRQKSDAVILVISAKDEIDTKVWMLEHGADDYLCKPFDLKELRARIDVVLRRHEPKNQVKSHEGIRLLSDLRTVEYQGNTQKLTKHEYAILELLMKHPKRAFTKQEIYEYAWGGESYIEDKTIHVHISNLRNKLANLIDRDVIETIWGIGFKWKEKS